MLVVEDIGERRGGGRQAAFSLTSESELALFATFMSSVAIKLKPPKNHPTKLALDIIKNIIARKGPIETKQLWALSQKVQLTPEELEQDRLEREKLSEIDQLTTPGWVPPDKPPAKEKAPPGLSRAEQKKHRKLQAQLTKAKKLDNGHPIKSTTWVAYMINLTVR